MAVMLLCNFDPKPYILDSWGRAVMVLCNINPKPYILDSWGRAVMVLCNLAYLCEKSKRFGYSAALRELKEAQLGLRFERKKFLDFRSWQDMYCAWSDQVCAESVCPLAACELGLKSAMDSTPY
jgi:hypothetical protein